MRAVAVLLLAGGIAWAAGPRPTLSPEQKKLDGEREALWQQAQQKVKCGERAAAIVAMEKTPALSQRVWGEHSRLAWVDSSWLAQWEQQSGRWGRAAGHWERIAGITAVLWGE